MFSRAKLVAAGAWIGAGLLAASCGQTNTAGPGSTGSLQLRLGYFPNITHATAIVGIEKGIFSKALAGKAMLDPQVFKAGPEAMQALLSGGLDASYVGPSPALNAFVKSAGRAVRIVSGATIGGAYFVTAPWITSPAQLKGTKVASPQLGNTQDVALRTWLRSKGLHADLQGGGDVSIVPQDNAQTLEAFKTGSISGAWVPEPWATRLIQEAGAHVLVDERDLWPGGKYATTDLVVASDFLRAHPKAVRALIEGQVAAGDYIAAGPADAKNVVNAAIGKLTGKKLPAELIRAAWNNLEFSNDPVADSLNKSATDAQSLGLIEKFNFKRIFDLDILNKVLASRGRAAVASG